MHVWKKTNCNVISIFFYNIAGIGMFQSKKTKLKVILFLELDISTPNPSNLKLIIILIMMSVNIHFLTDVVCSKEREAAFG
jgi:hypothetical protein